VASVTVFVGVLSVCPHSKRKMAGAINTKLGTHILCGSRLACIDPEVKKIKGEGHTVTKAVTVTWLLVAAVAALLYCCRCGTVTTTTTTTRAALPPFVPDYPGEPVPEETFTHSHLS